MSVLIFIGEESLFIIRCTTHHCSIDYAWKEKKRFQTILTENIKDLTYHSMFSSEVRDATIHRLYTAKSLCEGSCLFPSWFRPRLAKETFHNCSPWWPGTTEGCLKWNIVNISVNLHRMWLLMYLVTFRLFSTLFFPATKMQIHFAYYRRCLAKDHLNKTFSIEYNENWKKSSNSFTFSSEFSRKSKFGYVVEFMIFQYLFADVFSSDFDVFRHYRLNGVY